jgi:glycosyltransferase involved in cell wall biosynthesis
LRLLFVGNDFERKGGHDLIAVFQQHLHSTCELDVVSGGVATLPVMAGLRLHRGLSSDSAALLQLYADADVFVMPTYEDAFGLVYVEAMAAGLPCIGSNVLAVPELVQHEVTGLIVEAGNREQLRRAVEKLRDYPELRATLATAAQAFARSECDEAKNCARLASIFRQVGQDIPSMSV